MVLEDLLRDYLSKCFSANFTSSMVRTEVAPLAGAQQRRLRNRQELIESNPCSQALHVMLPNVSTQFLRSFARRGELDNFVTTFIPPFQINLEVEFMLQRNQAVNSFGWMVRVPRGTADGAWRRMARLTAWLPPPAPL